MSALLWLFFLLGNGKCDNQTNQCPANASCINTHGGHTCSCVRGFFWDGVNCTGITCDQALLFLLVRERLVEKSDKLLSSPSRTGRKRRA